VLAHIDLDQWVGVGPHASLNGGAAAISYHIIRMAAWVKSAVPSLRASAAEVPQ
jgi:hypothetical protein